jgi:hypothetical protein
MWSSWVHTRTTPRSLQGLHRGCSLRLRAMRSCRRLPDIRLGWCTTATLVGAAWMRGFRFLSGTPPQPELRLCSRARTLQEKPSPSTFLICTYRIDCAG